RPSARPSSDRARWHTSRASWGPLTWSLVTTCSTASTPSFRQEPTSIPPTPGTPRPPSRPPGGGGDSELRSRHDPARRYHGPDHRGAGGAHAAGCHGAARRRRAPPGDGGTPRGV